MAAPQAILRMQRDGRVCTFQVEGAARVDQGLTLRRAAEQALGEGVTALRVDLRHCSFMDSTFLGTLLYLKRTAERCGGGEFALVSPSVPCARLLHQMALDGLCTIVTAEEPAGAGWQEPACAPQEPGAFKRQIVEAHEELASLEGPAGEPFREVMRCLNRDARRP